MNAPTTCPCCSTPLLHHLGNHREYWFCRHCWQEMPDLASNRERKYQRAINIISLSTGLSRFNQPSLVGS